MSVFHATKRHPIVNQIGMVIGSQSPWIEVICLRNGASKIITVDYYESLKIEHENMSYLNANDLIRNSEK